MLSKQTFNRLSFNQKDQSGHSVIKVVFLLASVWAGAFVSYFILLAILALFGLSDVANSSVADTLIKALPYFVIVTALIISFLLLNNLTTSNKSSIASVSKNNHIQGPVWRRMSAIDLFFLFVSLPILYGVLFLATKWFNIGQKELLGYLITPLLVIGLLVYLKKKI